MPLHVTIFRPQISDVYFIHMQVFNDAKMGPSSQAVTCMIFDNRNDQLLTGEWYFTNMILIPCFWKRSMVEAYVACYDAEYLYGRICKMHLTYLSGSATLDAWPLMKTVQDSLENPQSHERPIVQVLCVTKLNLVITVCTGSTLKVRQNLFFRT